MTDLDSARPRARPLDTSAVNPTVTPSGKDVEQKQFVTARRGYERHEVRAFLRIVATHLDRLERQLERTVSTNAELQEQLARAELDVATLRADVAEQRLMYREASSRLELCDVLREDALARANSAEEGRQHAEDLMVQVIQSYRPRQPEAESEPVAPRRDGHGPDAGPPRQAVPAAVDPEVAQRERATAEPTTARATAATGATAARTYLLTADQIRAIEEAAATPGETARGQAARILEAARRNADRVNRAAHDLAQLWDALAGVVPDGTLVDREVPLAPQAASDVGHRTQGEPAAPAHGAMPPVRFTTNQARAAAAALHSSARDDLRLAEFWIQEAEQEASQDAVATSRIILEEAHQLLNMAAELGHPAPELLAQYTELDRRTRRPMA